MALELDDDHLNPDDDSVFQSRTFPRYCPRPRPNQTQYIPATPRAAGNYLQSGTTPSNSERSSASSSTDGSSFFFTISSSSSSSTTTSLSAQDPHPHSYRCSFRGKEAIAFRRTYHPASITPEKLKQRLSVIGAIRHTSVVQLIGASMSEKEPLATLIYCFINGPTLTDCLAASSSSNNGPYHCYASTWMSRMEIALGVAGGLEYIHHRTGFDDVLVHNRIKSSNIILTMSSNPSSQLFKIRAMICNFGLGHASGEVQGDDDNGGAERGPLMEEDEEGYPYMSPELLREGLATQKSDVYAFGVLLLELLSGTTPLTYNYDVVDKVYVRRSIVETARATLSSAAGDGGEEESVIQERVRGWVDGRLNYRFPVKMAAKAMRVAVECVDENPCLRPDMRFVEGIIFECHRKSNKLIYA